MEENLLPELPNSKIYNNNAIYLGTFLGGPLAAGYMMAENFKSFGQGDKVIGTYVLSFILMGFIMVVPEFIPNSDKIPSIAYALVNLVFVMFLVGYFQSKELAAHQTKGGLFYSRWRAAAIGGICLVLTLVLSLGLVMLLELE